MTNRFGLSQDDTALLKNAFDGRGFRYEVWIFGSRARGKFHKFSDVDLLLRATPPLSAEQKSDILEYLEEGNLPYKVDLVCEPDIYEPYRRQLDLDKHLLFAG